MDKYENKVKIEEIKSLISEGAYEDAADIADTVDWSSVKNVSSVGMVSDLYKLLKRYEEARNVLTFAYNKQKSRPIVRSMCELSITMGDLMSAIGYFREFKEIAPKDPHVYILQYKIFKSQNISLEEQIEVLEALKEKDYQPKWAYELATLYHKAGMESKCVEECNEIILWFVDGRYVLKAYELKAQHQPLTEQENYKYEVLRQAGGSLNIQYSLREDEPKVEEKKEFAIGQDVSPFNTQNLQAVVAEGLQDVLDQKTTNVTVGAPTSIEEAVAMDEAVLSKNDMEVQSETDSNLLVTQMYNPIVPEPPVGQELEGEKAIVEEEVAHSDMDIIGDATTMMAADILKGFDNEDDEVPAIKLNQNTDEIKLITGELPKVDIAQGAVKEEKDPINDTGIIETFHRGSSFDDLLTQGYDGQISLVLPEEQVVEKQITGQLSIADVMQEWERKKRENEEKLVADVKARIHNQASTLLADFEESTKSSLLGQIENAMVNAALKEEHDRIVAGRPKEIKVSDIAVEPEKKTEKKPEKPKPSGYEVKPKPVEEEEKPEELVEELVEEALEEATDETKDKVKKTEPEIKEEVAEDNEEVLEDVDEEEEDIDTDEDSGVEEIDEIDEDIEDESDEEYESDEATDEDYDDDDSYDEEEYEDDLEDDDYEEEVNQGPRDLSDAELEQFGAFAHHRRTQRQIADVLDNVTLSSYTGNILVSSEEDSEVTTFSKLLIQEIQQIDSNFTGKVAMISGESLNRKGVEEALEKVKNGAMIISEPQLLKKKTVESLIQELNNDDLGVVLIMQGHADILDKIVEQNKGMAEAFNLRVDLEAFDDRTLVEYAHNYAYDRGYSIDTLAELALHTRISDMQTADHEVTLAEIEDIIEDAIYYADKKTPAHLFGAMFGKKYDDERLIILREKDFMHY